MPRRRDGIAQQIVLGEQQDVTAQGFVDVALHPLVQAVVRAYVGPDYALCEAKGWRSLPN